MFHVPGIYIYTDYFDSYRVIEEDDGGITKHSRVPVLKNEPCRCYNNPTPDLSVTEQSSSSNANNQMCCAPGIDIKTGDEIIVYRNGLTQDRPVSTTRYFAGRPNDYRMPFMGTWADIEHTQVALLNEERVD